jgi:hypothetical protein
LIRYHRLSAHVFILSYAQLECGGIAKARGTYMDKKGFIRQL